MIKRKGPTTMQLDMTKGRPLPVILRFTIPLVIGNVFQQLYNMADTIIVGRYVGAGALAAVGSTGTIMFLTTGFAQGITGRILDPDCAEIWCQGCQRRETQCGKRILLSVIAAIIMTVFCVCIMNPRSI